MAVLNKLDSRGIRLHVLNTELVLDLLLTDLASLSETSMTGLLHLPEEIILSIITNLPLIHECFNLLTVSQQSFALINPFKAARHVDIFGDSLIRKHYGSIFRNAPSSIDLSPFRRPLTNSQPNNYGKL
jgi:hypothetical protein